MIKFTISDYRLTKLDKFTRSASELFFMTFVYPRVYDVNGENYPFWYEIYEKKEKVFEKIILE